MAGRRQFESVVAQAPKKRLAMFVQTPATAVAISGNEVIQIFAPANMVARVIAMRLIFLAPATATSGHHEVYVFYNTGLASNLTKFYGESKWSSAVLFDSGYFTAADNKQQPVNETSQVNASQDIIFDDTTPLMFSYWNNTDKQQTGQRTYLVEMMNEEVR